MDNHLLNIVDSGGNPIGEEDRTVIHQKGLLHRIVHVWFYTPERKIIFQVRGHRAETYPNLLDATVGGHVEIGQDYVQAAMAETREETGVEVRPEELVLVKMRKSGPTPDTKTGTINHHLAAIFAYRFSGNINALQAEGDEDGGIRFEEWPIDSLDNLREEQRARFIPSQLEPDYMEVFNKISDLCV